jgi:hypothetical protein
MNRRLVPIIVIATLLASCASSYAADNNQKRPVFTVTPRVWVAYVSLGDEGWTDSAAFALPMYGLSISVSPRQTPNWSFLINGYRGTADGDITATVPGAAQYPGTADYERFDVELLVRYTIPRTGLSLFSGPRYVKWRRTQSVPQYSGTFNRLDTDTWAPEFGIGYVSDVGESGRHRIFSNFTVGISRTSWRVDQRIVPAQVFANVSGNETQISMDGNLGYEFNFAKFASASVRYRHFVLRENPGYGLQRFTSYYGPEFGLSFRF